MKNIVKIGLTDCLILGLSGCAEKFNEEQAAKMSKFKVAQKVRIS